MTAPTMDRALAQRMTALDRAQPVREQRAQLKRDLKAGEVSIVDVLLEPPEWLASARVFDLLLAVPNYGRARVTELTRNARVSPSTTVARLTPLQRMRIASHFRTATPARPAPERPPGGNAPDTQHMRALGEANRIRLARARLKAEIESGDTTVAETVRDVPRIAATMTIGALLDAQHRWGTDRTRRFCAAVQVAETKPLCALTPRQRDEIAARLDGTYQPPPKPKPKRKPARVAKARPVAIVGEHAGVLHLRPVANAGTALCRLAPRDGWTARSADAWTTSTSRCETCAKAEAHDVA